MSDDSKPTPRPLPPFPASPPTGDVPPEAPEGLRPRRVQPLQNPNDHSAPEPTPQILAFSTHLQNLLEQAGVSAQSQGSAFPTYPPAVTSKNRRFTAKVGAQPAARQPLPAAFETGDDTDTLEDAPTFPPEQPGEGGGIPSSERREKRRLKEQRRFRNTVLGMIGLALGCLVAGRMTAPGPLPPAVDNAAAARTDKAAPPSPAWPEAALARLDDILATDRAGKLEEAEQAVAVLRKERGPLPGLDLYVGNLEARRKRYSDANVAVSPEIGIDIPPPLDAAACDQMGFIYCRQRVFKRATEYFSHAVANDPFRVEYYYHLGEALRRQGKLAEALTVFQGAFNRLPITVENQTLGDCLSLKTRLATIELGRGSELRPALEEQLKNPAPSGYWLLTAGALALQESRLPDAVAALEKARGAMPSALYDEMVSDYFFRASARHPEIAVLLPVNNPAREEARVRSGAYFLDP